LTEKRAESNLARVGSCVPQEFLAMMAKVASSRASMRRAEVREGRLETAALMMSRRDVMRLMSRITRNARNSLPIKGPRPTPPPPLKAQAELPPSLPPKEKPRQARPRQALQVDARTHARSCAQTRVGAVGAITVKAGLTTCPACVDQLMPSHRLVRGTRFDCGAIGSVACFDCGAIGSVACFDCGAIGSVACFDCGASSSAVASPRAGYP
jgi:hypothetical protein